MASIWRRDVFFASAALLLPTAGADTDLHAKRLAAVPDTAPAHPTVQQAAAAVVAHMKAFLNLL